MNLKRTAIICVGGAAIAAWLSAAIAPARPPISTVATVPAPVDASGAALASEIARLREHLRPTSAPRQAMRNPFLFGSPRRKASTSVDAPAATDSGINAIAPDVSGERPFGLSLAGIAEDRDPATNASIRTAIISGRGQLFLAKQGDTVYDGGTAYTVGTISADAVDLAPAGDAVARRLVLR
jgi:hypothetical protein